ncbi:hypothetical protein MHBO_001132 [Bonamia ostreae]|uniref:Uncharacterized protein n=1 Tax=Bonamia ostreae TaxID=126728 RepID=A0ABV2AHY7_9EUKA
MADPVAASFDSVPGLRVGRRPDVHLGVHFLPRNEEEQNRKRNDKVEDDAEPGNQIESFVSAKLNKF